LHDRTIKINFIALYAMIVRHTNAVTLIKTNVLIVKTSFYTRTHLTWSLESEAYVPGEPLLFLLASANQNTLVVLEGRLLLLIRSLGLIKA
jgi:hypothetical protein